MQVHTELATSTADQIAVRGLDLCRDLIGRVSLTDMIFLEVQGRLPSTAESRLMDAILVALVEHGFTPSSIVTRLTQLGSPDYLQGAVAAGLLGLGSTFVGSIEGAAHLLQDALSEAAPTASPTEVADALVAATHQKRQPVPGLGHHLHKEADPRVVRLHEVAAEVGLVGRHTQVMLEITPAFERATGRHLPLNATGMIGALASDMGFDWRICRAFGVIARTVGLVGHLWEEMASPVARNIWGAVEEAASEAPAPQSEPEQA